MRRAGGRALLLVSILAILAILAVAAGTLFPKARVLDYSFSGHSRVGTDYIRGTVKNVTAHTLDTVRIEFFLLSEDGTQIGSEVASVESLGPHNTTTFRVDLERNLSRNVSQVELGEIKTY